MLQIMNKKMITMNLNIPILYGVQEVQYMENGGVVVVWDNQRFKAIWMPHPDVKW